MAQSTILASGDARATSTDVVIAAGATVTIGIFVSSGSIVPGMCALVWIDTPGADIRETELGHLVKDTQITGPCTARVERVAGSFGVFLET